MPTAILNFSANYPQKRCIFGGKTQNTLITNCSYFGLLFANTSTTGSAYYFDDIIVTGEKADDKEAPVWENVSFQGNDKLRLTFSEK